MQRAARTRRMRQKIVITADRPRLSVFRSLKHISGQIIDQTGNVLIAASDRELTKKTLKGVARAAETGKLLATRAKEKKITNVVFDKSHYAYHGRVKAFADAAREAGLSF